MQIVLNSEELPLTWVTLRGKLALVPTMGALHAGHMALIAEARTRADPVAASIFVNPAQFGEGEDFGRYPCGGRTMRRCSMPLAAICWLRPSRRFIRTASRRRFSVSGSRSVGRRGAPGHFDGVATVVAKLLLSVRPDIALFGEKDFQQLAVIRRMVADLASRVEIVGVPTVRDPDGLALSSRNAYLSVDERSGRSPCRARSRLRAMRSVGGTAVVQHFRCDQAARCTVPRFDYFALVDAATLEPLEVPQGEMRLIAAAVIGTTRLIDNIAV